MVCFSALEIIITNTWDNVGASVFFFPVLTHSIHMPSLLPMMAFRIGAPKPHWKMTVGYQKGCPIR